MVDVFGWELYFLVRVMHHMMVGMIDRLYKYLLLCHVTHMSFTHNLVLVAIVMIKRILLTPLPKVDVDDNVLPRFVQDVTCLLHKSDTISSIQ